MNFLDWISGQTRIKKVWDLVRELNEDWILHVAEIEDLTVRLKTDANANEVMIRNLREHIRWLQNELDDRSRERDIAQATIRNLEATDANRPG